MYDVNICSYTAPEALKGLSANSGYIVVDGDNNGYATDTSGYIFKFNLDTCEKYGE